MTDLLSDIGTWSVLKWVILVLVAGFIGQFGKTMAQAIMGRIRQSKPKKLGADGAEPPLTPKPDAPPVLPGADDRARPAGMGTTDKKTLKTLAKLQKKAIKKGGK